MSRTLRVIAHASVTTPAKAGAVRARTVVPAPRGGRAQRLAMELPGDQWDKLSACAAALAEFQLSEHGPLLRSTALTALPEQIRRVMAEHSNRVSDRFASMISDGIAEGSIRPVDPFIASKLLAATLNACAELGYLVPDVRPKAAPAVFVRPLMTGIFKH